MPSLIFRSSLDLYSTLTATGFPVSVFTALLTFPQFPNNTLRRFTVYIMITLTNIMFDNIFADDLWSDQGSAINRIIRVHPSYVAHVFLCNSKGKSNSSVLRFDMLRETLVLLWLPLLLLLTMKLSTLPLSGGSVKIQPVQRFIKRTMSFATRTVGAKYTPEYRLYFGKAIEINTT